MRFVLPWPHELAFRVRTLTFPNAGEDAVAAWVADFGEALDLKEQATWIDVFDGAVGELVGQEVVHQDAVAFAEELGQDGCRDEVAGGAADAAKELSDGWKPASLEMGQGDAGVRKDGKGDAGMELSPIECDLQEGSELRIGANVLEQLKSSAEALLVSHWLDLLRLFPAR